MTAIGISCRLLFRRIRRRRRDTRHDRGQLRQILVLGGFVVLFSLLYSGASHQPFFSQYRLHDPVCENHSVGTSRKVGQDPQRPQAIGLYICSYQLTSSLSHPDNHSIESHHCVSFCGMYLVGYVRCNHDQGLVQRCRDGGCRSGEFPLWRPILDGLVLGHHHIDSYRIR